MARFSRSASVHLGYVHLRGEQGSTSDGDWLAFVVLVVVVVNRCVSRTVAAKVDLVGSGMRVRAGVSGRLSVDFVC